MYPDDFDPNEGDPAVCQDCLQDPCACADRRIKDMDEWPDPDDDEAWDAEYANDCPECCGLGRHIGGLTCLACHGSGRKVA